MLCHQTLSEAGEEFREAQKIHGQMAKKIREKEGFSLRGLARKMEVSPGFVCDLEKGNRTWTIKTVKAWRKALGI